MHLELQAVLRGVIHLHAEPRLANGVLMEASLEFERSCSLPAEALLPDGERLASLMR